MKCPAAPSLCLALCGAVALGGAAGHPVEKAIVLLKDLITQVNKEAQEEEYLYGKFEHWCTGSKKTLGEAITEEKETIEKLGDVIDAKTEEIDVLTKQTAALADQLLELENQGKEADALRKKENDLFTFEQTQ